MTREEAMNQALKTYGESLARAELVHREKVVRAKRQFQEELHLAEFTYFLAIEQAVVDLRTAAGQAGAVLPKGLVPEKEAEK